MMAVYLIFLLKSFKLCVLVTYIVTICDSFLCTRKTTLLSKQQVEKEFKESLIVEKQLTKTSKTKLIKYRTVKKRCCYLRV